MLNTGAFLNNLKNIKSVTEPFLILSIRFAKAPPRHILKLNLNKTDLFSDERRNIITEPTIQVKPEIYFTKLGFCESLP